MALLQVGFPKSRRAFQTSFGFLSFLFFASADFLEFGEGKESWCQQSCRAQAQCKSKAFAERLRRCVFLVRFEPAKAVSSHQNNLFFFSSDANASKCQNIKNLWMDNGQKLFHWKGGCFESPGAVHVNDRP